MTMTFRKLSTLFAIALAAQSAYAALELTQASFASFELASSLMPSLVSTKKMAAGKWDFVVAPSYLTYSEDRPSTTPGAQPSYQKMTGFGGAIALHHSITQKFGINILGLGYAAAGDGKIYSTVKSGYGENKASGWGASIGFTYDPFNDQNSAFRLPVFLGVGFLSVLQEATAQEGPDSLTSTAQLNAPAVTLGLAPQWELTSWLQITPFALVSMPLADSTDACTAAGSATCPTLTPVNKDVGTVGVDLKFIPLDLSLNYIPKLGQASAYALKWETSF